MCVCVLCVCELDCNDQTQSGAVQQCDSKRNRDKVDGVAYECHLQVQIFTFMAQPKVGYKLANMLREYLYTHTYIYTP